MFTPTKRNLLEAGKTYSDVFILDIGQQGSLAEFNFEKTENKLIAMIHQENTQEQEAANQHRCH